MAIERPTYPVPATAIFILKCICYQMTNLATIETKRNRHSIYIKLKYTWSVTLFYWPGVSNYPLIFPSAHQDQKIYLQELIECLGQDFHFTD